jgi:hypothetical protein
MKLFSRTLIVAFLLLAAGCGSEYPTARVSGRILVDGKPVAKLRVTFAPIGTAEKPISGPPSIAYTDEEGRYTLKTVEHTPGAVIGPCRVRISTVEEADLDFNAKVPSRPARRLPPIYNDETTLTFEVPREGTDSADFNITWK